MACSSRILGGVEGGGETRTHVEEWMAAQGERKEAGQSSEDWKRRGSGQDVGTSLTQGPWGFTAQKASSIPLH